jgi:hypothetical protein
MRQATMLILLAGLSGCAAGRPASMAKPVCLSYAQSPSAALVFDPPASLYAPRLDLSREGRQPAAFVGFDETTTTSFYTRSDDQQNPNGSNRLFRQAISEKTGISYR